MKFIFLMLAFLSGYAIAAPPTFWITNTVASNVTATTADIATYIGNTGGASPVVVSAYWGITDGGTDPLLWENSYTFSESETMEGCMVHAVSNLYAGTYYYANFLITNNISALWGSDVITFVTEEESEGGGTSGGQGEQGSQELVVTPTSEAQHFFMPAMTATNAPYPFSVSVLYSPPSSSIPSIPTNGVVLFDKSLSPASALLRNPCQITVGMAGSASPVTSYRFHNATTSTTYYVPKRWTFSGSTNGSSFAVLDERSNQTWTAGTWSDSYMVSNPVSYPYVRIDVTSPMNPTNVSINEIEFYTTWTKIKVEGDRANDAVNGYSLLTCEVPTNTTIALLESDIEDVGELMTAGGAKLWWDFFDPGSSFTNAYDASGNNNTGSIYFGSGVVNNFSNGFYSLRSTTTNYIRSVSDSLLRNANEFTIAAWCYYPANAESSNTYEFIVGTNAVASDVIDPYIHSLSRQYLTTNGTNTSIVTGSYGSQATLTGLSDSQRTGVWHRVVLTHNNRSIYKWDTQYWLDGVLKNSKSSVYPSSTPLAGFKGNLNVGRAMAIDEFQRLRYVDDVVIDNKAWNPISIANDYASGRTTNYPLEVWNKNPANGSDGYLYKEVWSWSGQNAMRYSIYGGYSNDTFALLSPLISSTSYSPLIQARYSTNYHWRVDTVTPNGFVVTGMVNRFYIPEYPTLVSPSSGTIVDPSVPVTLTWKQIEAGSDWKYHINVVNANNNTYTNSGSSIVVTSPASLNTSTSWRMLASNSLSTSPNSAAWTFVTRSAHIPATPALSAPANGTTGVQINQSVSHNWTMTSDAYVKQYGLYTRNGGSGSYTRRVLTANPSPSTRSIAYNSPSTFNTLVQWYIVAYGTEADSTSSIFSYRTRTAVAPSIPSNVWPVANATPYHRGETVNFEATMGANTVSYEVIVDDSVRYSGNASAGTRVQPGPDRDITNYVPVAYGNVDWFFKVWSADGVSAQSDTRTLYRTY